MTEQMNVPKLRFVDFSDTWRKEKLGNFVEINSGDSPSKFKMLEEGIPFFKVEQLNNSVKYQTDSIYFINEPKKVISKGSVIFPKRGASILLNKIRILKQPSFMDTNLMTLTANEQINNEFLYYFILREDLSTLADTTSIPQINNKHILPYPITLPSLPEQQKIASFLSKVDEKIALLTEKKAKLTEYKKGVMQQLFDGSFQEQDGKLVFVPPTLRFKADDGSEFPDWEEKRFDDIFNFSSGKNIKQNEASPDFTIPCVRYGELYHLYGEVITTVVNHTNLESSELTFSEGNEILLPSAGEDPLDIGAASALTLKGVAIGRTINVLRPKTKDSYSHIYVSYYINNKLKKKISTLARGASISNVYNSDLKGLSIPLPSLKEQQVVESFLIALEKKLALANTELEKVKEWKKGLLQQMFV